MMTKYAVVEQSALNKLPTLKVGELTPETVRDWENACLTYFMHKEIEAKDQVKMIAFGMSDPRLHTWYLAQRATLDAGTFSEYLTALKSAWLETHWDTKLRKKVLGSQQGTRPFYEWALELQNQNALLYGNAAHLTTPVLRAKLADTLTLKQWIKEVKHLDDKRLEDLALHKKFTKQFYKSSRRTTSTYHAKTSSTSRPNATSSTCLEPLTEDKCTLLANHRGCFKC
jgi:hypothetical protein